MTDEKEKLGADRIEEGSVPMPKPPRPKGFDGNRPADQIDADHMGAHAEEVRLLREQRENEKAKKSAARRASKTPPAYRPENRHSGTKVS